MFTYFCPSCCCKEREQSWNLGIGCRCYVTIPRFLDVGLYMKKIAQRSWLIRSWTMWWGNCGSQCLRFGLLIDIPLDWTLCSTFKTCCSVALEASAWKQLIFLLGWDWSLKRYALPKSALEQVALTMRLQRLLPPAMQQRRPCCWRSSLGWRPFQDWPSHHMATLLSTKSGGKLSVTVFRNDQTCLHIVCDSVQCLPDVRLCACLKSWEGHPTGLLG